MMSVISHSKAEHKSFKVFKVILRFFRRESNVPVLMPNSLIKAYWLIFFDFKVFHSGSNVIKLITP